MVEIKKKSITFSAKIPKRKDNTPSIKYPKHSKSFWPIPIRSGLFLPYFSLKNEISLANLKPKNNINSILGRGQFGTVYAYQKTTENSNTMAVKVLKKSSVIEENAVIQIIQEIRIHSVCSAFPHVLPFISAWQDRFYLYVASQLCPKGSLADLMNSRNGQPLPKQAILMAAQQLYSGLSAIHNLGVIFRDLKLKNILISEFGNLNISDFGLAKWLNRHQRTYTICGTLSFMAPEVALSQPYHHSVDLWSLGMVLFSLAFGFLPYSKAKDHEELAKLQNNQPLLEFNHEDSEVKILLENLLLSDPNSRYFECEQTADLDPFAKVATFFDELQT